MSKAPVQTKQRVPDRTPHDVLGPFARLVTAMGYPAAAAAMGLRAASSISRYVLGEQAVPLRRLVLLVAAAQGPAWSFEVQQLAREVADAVVVLMGGERFVPRRAGLQAVPPESLVHRGARHSADLAELLVGIARALDDGKLTDLEARSLLRQAERLRAGIDTTCEVLHRKLSAA